MAETYWSVELALRQAAVGEITDLDPAHHPEQGGLERPEIGGGDEDPHELVVLPGQQSREELTEHVGDGEDTAVRDELDARDEVDDLAGQNFLVVEVVYLERGPGPQRRRLDYLLHELGDQPAVLHGGGIQVLGDLVENFLREMPQLHGLHLHSLALVLLVALEMSGGDSLQVLTGVAGQLEDLSSEVLQDQDGGAVDSSGGSNSAASEGPGLEVTMDPRKCSS